MAVRRAITFDVDWAPDTAIARCAEICVAAGVPATFFATHPSAVVRELQADSRFEVGIHPNFLPGSSQGGSVVQIIDYCLDLVPDARSMRTHGLVQSSHLLNEIIDHAPQIQNDVSLFLYRHPGLRPVEWFSPQGNRLIRMPYFWEDDLAAARPDWSWDGVPEAMPETGLQIFNFHPIHVALNLRSADSYEGLKRSLKGKPLWQATNQEITAFASTKPGVAHFLEGLLADCKNFATISSLVATNEPCS